MIPFTDLYHKATELGFDACGVAPVQRLSRERERLERWLQRGYHAGMNYMTRHLEKREDVTKLVEGARSVIVTLTNYYSPSCQQPGAPIVARYAYGKDYHRVIKDRLHSLYAYLQEWQVDPSLQGRVFVDSAPVFEHEWARRAGLGWIGKNTLLIHPAKGSFCFIGVIISNADFDHYAEPFDGQFCGHCQRCVEACPTGALSDYCVDANRCISYNTIERQGEIPSEVKEKMGQRFFGCDACQECCPWNKRAIPHRVEAFSPNEKLMQMTREAWLDLDETAFLQDFSDSPLTRPGLAQLKRNLSTSGSPADAELYLLYR